MEIAKQKTAKVGRPVTLDPNTKYGFIKVNQNIHNTIKTIAEKEERNIQTVTDRILKKALNLEGYSDFN